MCLSISEKVIIQINVIFASTLFSVNTRHRVILRLYWFHWTYKCYILEIKFSFILVDFYLN